jgi:hypothetical protein
MSARREAGTLDVKDAAKRHDVHVNVDYLPAKKSFQQKYPLETPVGTVRSEAMEFFGVRDRQERDKYEYFLEFDGGRLTNMSQPLEDLLGEKGKKAVFHLVEQITPGLRCV